MTNATAHTAQHTTPAYVRSVSRAAGMIRRAEREGFGRNSDSSTNAIANYLLNAQRIAARELAPDAVRADRFADLVIRAEDLGIYL